MKKVISIIVVLLLVSICTIQAQDVALEKHPGYVDLEEIDIPGDAEDITDISLGPAFLRLLQEFTEDMDDDEIPKFSGLISIRIKAFDVHYRDEERIRSKMEKIAAQLKKEDWEMFVHLKGEDEFVNISVKFDGERIIGIMLMALESGDEAAFVNVVGNEIDSSIRMMGKMSMGWNGAVFRWFDKFDWQ